MKWLLSATLLVALGIPHSAAACEHPWLRPEPRPLAIASLGVPEPARPGPIPALDARPEFPAAASRPEPSYGPNPFTSTEFLIGTGAFWGGFTADVVTTRSSIARGATEQNPLLRNPDGSAKIGVATVVTVGVYGALAFIYAKGGPKIRRFAVALLWLGGGLHAAAAVHNHGVRRR
jgi:hypothetical protein